MVKKEKKPAKVGSMKRFWEEEAKEPVHKDVKKALLKKAKK